MNIGIIAEYNPFHNGHKYQIDMIKKINPNANIIILQSGNFVQRGDVSILDKFTRCEMALLSGADLVLEIPDMFATASASYFANQCVRIFDKLNSIDKICFGVENVSTESLSSLSEFLLKEPLDYKMSLKENLKKGYSFPKSRALTLSEFGFNGIVDTPNNILGTEYIKALIDINSKIEPLTINRTNNYHDKNIVSEISSATSIRENLTNIELIKKAIPPVCFDVFSNKLSSVNYDISMLSNIFHYEFNIKSKREILEIVDITEDIYNRFKKVMNTYFYIPEIVDNMCSKNLTKTRIQRMVLSILLNNKKSDLNLYNENTYPFVRVLGFKKEKDFLVSDIIKNSDIKILTNIKNANKILNSSEMSLLEKDIRKTSVFLLSDKKNEGKSINAFSFENKMIIL